MFIKSLDQKGFAAFEAVLIVVIVAILGGTGYYIYHSNKVADKLYNSASKTSSVSSASKNSNGGKGGGVMGDKHSQTGPAKAEVYIINEWKVASEIPTPPESAALIQYKINDSTPASASFTTQELIDAGGSSCAADRSPAGIIERASGGDTFYTDTGAPSGKTVAQELATGDFKPYKRVGNYYYWYSHPQSACGDIAKTQKLQTIAISEVKQIVTHLEQE